MTSLSSLATDIFDGRYVVWSNEHGAWWRADSAGYTIELLGAGLYSKDEAERICRMAAPRHEQCFPAIDKWRSLVGMVAPKTVFAALLEALEQSE